MNIIEKIFRRKKERTNNAPYTPYTLSFANYSNIAEEQALLLSVVYRCVDLISNSVAQLPLEIYDEKRNKVNNNLSYIINNAPNEYTNRFTFIKLLITSCILRGNAFAYIERNEEDEVVALHYIDSNNVTIKVVQGEIKREVYYIVGQKVYQNYEILHLINYSTDGINGISTISKAVNSLQLATESEATAKGFFNGGCNLGGIITVEGMLNSEQQKQLKDSWQQAFNTNTGTPNGVAVLQGNMKYQPISVTPADAQLLESRKYNVIDICRFFGVSPTKVFDLSKSSYSTIEAENIAFLSDTIQPILSKIENELNRKLFKPSERERYVIRFNTYYLLRTDKSTLANYYSTLFNIGVLSQNEIRANLDLPDIEGGDKHYIQVNLMSNGDGEKELQ